ASRMDWIMSFIIWATLIAPSTLKAVLFSGWEGRMAVDSIDIAFNIYMTFAIDKCSRARIIASANFRRESDSDASASQKHQRRRLPEHRPCRGRHVQGICGRYGIGDAFASARATA